MKRLNIVWTSLAERDIDAIYEFYFKVSEAVALKIITEIILETDKIVFSSAFQLDDINPTYRRIIVRHFKVLYRVVGNQIVVFAVFDTRQNPTQLKKNKMTISSITYKQSFS